MELEGYDSSAYKRNSIKTNIFNQQFIEQGGGYRRIRSRNRRRVSSSSNRDGKAYLGPLLTNAKQHLTQGKASIALAILRSSTHEESKNPEYHFLVGRAYQELKQNTESLKLLPIAIHLDPRNYKYWINRGLVKGALQGPQWILKDLSESLGL